MFNSKLRKTAVTNYEDAIKEYNIQGELLEHETNSLYQERKKAINLVKKVENYINSMANSPKEIGVTLNRIHIEISNFIYKQEQIKKAEKEAKIAGGGSSAAASLSALGLTVATLGPTAAMGIATTFGTAATGTAIASLSGAAASNAALAWIGGGTLAAGGSGVAGGSAFLALAGPVGWSIAGVMFAGSVGTGILSSNKNKKAAAEANSERKNIEIAMRKFKNMNSEVCQLRDSTISQSEGVTHIFEEIPGNDYSKFTRDEKLKVGTLVNTMLTLAQLINKELALDAN